MAFVHVCRWSQPGHLNNRSREKSRSLLPPSPAERSPIANAPRRVCTEGRAWRCSARPLAWCRCAMADTAGETSSRATATASRAPSSNRLMKRSFVPRIRTAMMEWNKNNNLDLVALLAPEHDLVAPLLLPLVDRTPASLA